MEEPTLIRQSVEGDTAAWEALVRAHQEAVFRLAYLIIGDPDEAEDVAQETFLRAWKHLRGFDTTRPLRPWLLSIASNLSSNRRRSAGRYFAALTRAFRAEPAPATVEEKSSDQAEANELWKAVQKLSMQDQQIVYLRYFLDLSIAEAAEVLQVAEGTIKSRLSRALEKLRVVIQREFPVLTEGHES